MRYLVLSGILVGLLASGCESGKYDDLQDASEADLKLAGSLWETYLSNLGKPQVGKDPILVASHFSRPTIASTTEEDFEKRIKKGLGRRSAGAFSNVDVVALKNGPDGPLLIIDSKAGQAAIPLVREGDGFKFSELQASTGDWSKEAKRGPEKMPDEPSLLYIKMMLKDEQAPVGDRLRAAVMLAKPKYRKVIISSQRAVTNTIVRLGLGLARIKIDGSDESFLRNFPTDPSGLSALQQADKEVFEEMIVKLANMGAMVEDPPANELLYKVAAGAPPALRERMGRALYKMAELNPARFANAVRNLAKDMEKDQGLAIYLEEVKRQGGQAPKLMKFLKKFSRIGEGEERQLCKALIQSISKAR